MSVVSGAIRIVFYALGALAILVIVNWARHEIVVGLIAAAALAIAATIASMHTDEVTEDEGTPPTG